jgi:hypothetical protein
MLNDVLLFMGCHSTYFSSTDNSFLTEIFFTLMFSVLTI